MRRPIYIHDHETLASLARKYPGRSIRWLRDRPRPTEHIIRREAFQSTHFPAALIASRWHRQA